MHDVRSAAARKRWDSGSLHARRPTLEIDDSSLRDFKKSWDTLDSTVKGSISEGYVKTKLAERGFDVWEPCSQNHRTDLIVMAGSAINRIQVKTGTYSLSTKCYQVNFSRHRRGGKRSDYESADVDFFVVYCAGLPRVDLYIIPATEINGKNRCPRLFPHRRKLLEYADSGPSMERFLNAFEVLSC